MSSSDKPLELQPNSASKHTLLWDVLVGLLPLIAMLPMLLFEVASLWSREHMRFFPLTIVALLILVGLNVREPGGKITLQRRWTAISLFILATLVYLYSVWTFSPWLSHFALVVCFCAWALGRLGNEHWTRPVALTGILATTLPLPFGWDAGFLIWLQGTGAWCATCALDALSIPCLLNGSLIESRGLSIVADEICGGIGNVYSFASFAAVLLTVLHRGMIVAIKVILLVPFWALLSNFIRLFAILAIFEYWPSYNLSDGRDYTILILCTNILSLLLIWASSNFFRSLFEPIPVADAEFGPVFSGLNKLFLWPQADPFEDVEPEDPDERKFYLKRQAEKEALHEQRSDFDWLSDKPAKLTVAVSAFTVVVCAFLPIRTLASQGLSNLNFGTPSISLEEIESLSSEDQLPATLEGGWNRIGFDITQRNPRSRLGQYSLKWRYSSAQLHLNAAIDLPFLGWHDPIAERIRLGWSSEDAKISVDNDWPWGEAELENELGGKAYIFYSLFTPSSQPFKNVPSHAGDRVNIASADMKDQDTSADTSPSATAENLTDTTITYSFEVFVETGVELSNTKRSVLRDIFLSLRERAMTISPAVDGQP